MTPPRENSAEDEELTLLDVLIVLAKHKRMVVGMPAVITVITALILLVVPNVYTATARIMPPQQNQSMAAAALAAATGFAGGLASPIGGLIGLKNPNDLYVAILRSDTIADHMIKRFSLRELYNVETFVDARKALDRASNITSGKDGLIVIDVDNEDPKRAADMANAYVEELDRLTQNLAVTDASQRRLFFERELKDVRESLASAETRLQNTQEKTGLIQPEGQSRAIFEAFADLRARVAAKEIELAAMRSFATANNPAYLRGREELKGLHAQLSKLERSQPNEGQGNILVPTTRVPEAGLEYLRRVRDVKYQETLFELLSKQYELAKIDEAKDAALIQVVDTATPPDRKSKPKRTVILLLTTAAAVLIAGLWAFLRESFERSRRQPEQAERLNLLMSYLRRWR